MLSRTTLITVKGITSTYTDPDQPNQKLDVSRLTSICYLTTDTNKALHKLNSQIQLAGGSLFVSDLYRSWSIQEQAYEDWMAGKRKDFAAPPGQSFHMAGRAIDIDTQHLNFSGSKAQWLDKFWKIAEPIGWAPIVTQPNAALSESWHFQFLGDDWQHLVGKVEDGQIAMAAILDSGQWDPKDPKLPILFLQSQCNRLLKDPQNASVLVLDGLLGPKTRGAVSALIKQPMDSWTVESATEKLINL